MFQIEGAGVARGNERSWCVYVGVFHFGTDPCAFIPLTTWQLSWKTTFIKAMLFVGSMLGVYVHQFVDLILSMVLARPGSEAVLIYVLQNLIISIN